MGRRPSDLATAEFRYEPATQTWHWSDALFRLHGFEPHEVVPTTSLVLAHQHPDDRERVLLTLERALREGGPFACLHRIRDASGGERVVHLAGVADPDPGGRCLRGTVTDLTHAIDAAAQVRASESIRASAKHRAAIEQAKGGLALALGISPERAFEVLRALSSDTSTSVRDLADDVVAALPQADGDAARLLERIAPSERERPTVVRPEV